MSADYKNIILKEEDGVAKIILNRPPLNILNIEMMKEIASAIDKTKAMENAKALVFSSEGKAFSAGVAVEEHTEDKFEEMIRVFHQIFHLLFTQDKPTVAVVRGAALGGGCELAVFCDMVIASESAKFGQPEIKLSVFPPIACALFPKAIPAKKAFELILTGDTITAKTAEDIGLINKAIPDDKIEEELKEFISRLTDKSVVALKFTRQAIFRGMEMDFETALKKIEYLYIDKLMKTEDAKEGLNSFMQKRKPVWKNK